MLNIERKVPLAEHTTFKTGGLADYFVTVTSEDELVEAVVYAKRRALPILILGGGSNVLISDTGWFGLVIHLAITSVEENRLDSSVLVTAGAGVLLDDLVSYTVSKDWWGLENLSHIPGTVGAAPVQNVGAYGTEIADLVERVRVFDVAKEVFIELTSDECRFSYRHSIFKDATGKRYVITGVTFKLSVRSQPRLDYADLSERFTDNVPTPKAVREEIISIRSQKFPDWREVGTAGSFFKNPTISQEHYNSLQEKYPDLPGYTNGEKLVKIPLGWVLDKIVGVRGKTEKGVGSYQGQALVLVNYGGATTKDVLAFAEQLEQAVHDATGIQIEKEVTFIRG